MFANVLGLKTTKYLKYGMEWPISLNTNTFANGATDFYEISSNQTD